jgi:CheY-like chemotaxis protein
MDILAFSFVFRDRRIRNVMQLEEASLLLVDDEPALLDVMRDLFRDFVERVFCAGNGAEALKVLAAHRIDLILTDVRMPVMDGVALIRKINEAHGQTPPVILITGFSDLTLREAQDLGAQAIVEKPIAYEDLLHEMRRSLRDPDELWQQPDVSTGRHTQLTTTFESLDAALREKRIAFGRRGFCIEGMSSLPEGPIDFTLDFKADQHVISGRGTVRWTAPEDRQAGVEITQLDDASRPWMIQLTKRYQPRPYIPGSTRLGPLSGTNAALGHTS